MTEHAVLHGIGVSAGTASGKAAIVRPAPGVDPDELPSADPAADGARVRAALAVVSASLKERAEKAPEESAPILNATAQLAADRGLAKAVDKKLKKGLGVTQAVHAAVEEYAEMLKSLGGYMAERATDLYDVRDRAICELRGLPAPGVPVFDEPVVLVAHDLADTLERDLARVREVVDDHGLVPALKELDDGVGADEAGPSRDENAGGVGLGRIGHGSSFRCVRIASKYSARPLADRSLSALRGDWFPASSYVILVRHFDRRHIHTH